MNNPLKPVFAAFAGLADMLLTQVGRDAGLESQADAPPQQESLGDRLVRVAAPSLTADN